MNENKQYIGTYKVVKLFRVSRRRQVIQRDLSREEAMALVNRYPSSQRSMVVFFNQFYADKYFV